MVEGVSAATWKACGVARTDQVPFDEQYCACCACAVASCASRALSLITSCLPLLPPVTTGCLPCSRLMFEVSCLHSSTRLDAVSGWVLLAGADFWGALLPGSVLSAPEAGGGLEETSGSLVRRILV